MGNGSVIRPGEVQRMSAGTGITHSEFNHSTSELVHFLQIWIVPSTDGMAPGYEQKLFPDTEKQGVLRLIASPDGRDESVTIHQDANLYAAVLEAGEEIIPVIPANRHGWLQVARGSVLVNGQTLEQGDGAAVTGENRVLIAGREKAEIIWFDLA